MNNLPQHPCKVSLILPCFNEMEHIGNSLEKIYDFLKFIVNSNDFELIAVDDGSTDGTREYLSKTAAVLSSLKVIFHDTNHGRGAAVRTGLSAATGNVFGTIDIDCEISEAYLAKFMESVIKGNDLVVARRYYNVSINPFIWFRHFLSSGYKCFQRLTISHSVKDTEAGYKFFSEKARTLVLERSKFDGWFWDTEICALAAMVGLRTHEIPVLFLRNPEKTSTVRPWPDSLEYLRNIRRFKVFMKDGVYNKTVFTSTPS